MKKLRVYIDTSVINFLFADDAPEKMDLTIRFFDEYIKLGSVEAFVSPIVIDEIMRTKKENKRNQLLAVISKYNLPLLDIENKPEILNLAQQLIDKHVLPPKSTDDAMHVAIAVIYELDVLVSWNFTHLANINRERRIAVLNQSEGYFYPLRITTPLEVMGS